MRKNRNVAAIVIAILFATLLQGAQAASAATTLGVPDEDKCYGASCSGYYWTRYNCKSTWKSAPVTLRHSQTNKPYGNAQVVLHYSSACASAWAHLSGADTTCHAVVARWPDYMGPSYSEPVEPGINYAYTKMLDDNGKLSHAVAYCKVVRKPDGSSTDFYFAETVSY